MPKQRLQVKQKEKTEKKGWGIRGLLRTEPKNKVKPKEDKVKKESEYVETDSALFTVLLPNMKTFTKKYNIVDKEADIKIGGGQNYIQKTINLAEHKPYLINSNGAFGGKEMYYIDWKNAKVIEDEDLESHFTYYTPEMLKKIGQSKFLRMLLKRRNLIQKPGTGGSGSKIWYIVFLIVGFAVYHLGITAGIIPWVGV